MTKILALTTAIGGARGTNMEDALGASSIIDIQKNVCMRRRIDTIIVHCSATKAGQNYTAAHIDRWHHAQGLGGIGYHYVICLNGKIEKGRDINQQGAHCRGWNTQSIGICYIGGLDANGKPIDTRTKAQKKALYHLIETLQREYPTIRTVIGHRDTSPDLNKNGVIEPQEYIKACPCFDVKEWLKQGRKWMLLLLAVLITTLMLAACKSKKEVYTRVATDSIVVSESDKRNIMQQLSASALSEQTEEHVEQTTFISDKHQYSLPVVRTVVNRKIRRNRKVEETTKRAMTDSTKRVGYVSVKEEKAEKVSGKRCTNSRKYGWVLGVLALTMIGGGWCLWKRR